MDGLLTTGEAAAVLGVSTERVRQLANDGTLRVAQRNATGRLFDPADVAALKQHRSKQGPASDKAVRGPQEAK